jgi:hypothetical protein
MCNQYLISLFDTRHGLAAVSVDDRYVIGGGPQPGGSQTNLN